MCADPAIKHPEKHILTTQRRAGCYQGCFAKWKRQRTDQKWDLLVQHAPKIARERAEVPNNLRNVLGIQTTKWTGSHHKSSDGLHVVPDVLARALDCLVLERLDAGEEVTIKLVENILVILIGVWNEHISEIHNEVQQMLEDLQQSDSDGNKEATSSNAATHAEQKLQALQPLNVSKHPKAMQNLECIK